MPSILRNKVLPAGGIIRSTSKVNAFFSKVLEFLQGLLCRRFYSRNKKKRNYVFKISYIKRFYINLLFNKVLLFLLYLLSYFYYISLYN